jgi:hypothetical protein
MTRKYIAIVVLIVAALLLGAYFYDKPVQYPPFSAEHPGREDSYGTLEGSHGFPSEFIPEDIRTCAENIFTGAEYCTDEHIHDDTLTHGVGYRLAVPEGQYHVYATTATLGPDRAGYRAYYSEFVICGLHVGCTSHEPIVVTVEAGQITRDIDPQDWYTF